MKFKLSLLSDIEIYEFEGKKLFLPLNSFFETVEKYRNTSDKPLRKDNFTALYKNEIISKGNVKYCSLSSVIKLCYLQEQKHFGCAKVCRQIEQLLVYNDVETDSTLDLYYQIAKFNFRHSPTLQTHINEHLNIDENTLSTLVGGHKDLFDEEQWKKILIFEWHFSMTYGSDFNYEELVQKKKKYFHDLECTVKLSGRIQTNAPKTIKRRLARRQASNHNEIVLMFTNLHCPAKIEDELVDLVGELDLCEEEELSVHVLDCTARCRRQCHGAHIYVQSHQVTETLMNDIAVICTSHLSRKHKLSTASVSFFNVTGDAAKSNRFRFRDLFLKGDICPVYTRLFDGQDLSTDEPCGRCFHKDGELRPLHWSDFAVKREWVLDVPLEEQLLFESFLSRTTVEKTNDVDTFFQTKCVRLYALHDALLNLRNKNYFGVIQELNTSELMVNYHCLTDIFKMTQMMGITQGGKHAENEWKTRATDELNYYNYAIRKYPLEYESVAGLVERLVSLRDCFVFAMRDNLVTLTEKSNPEPGESRTGQVNTIQGTDLGIPKDSLLVSNLHMENGCDGLSDTCACLVPRMLQKEDFKTVIVPTQEELQQLTSLRRLCRWGLLNVWSKASEGDDLGDLFETVPQDPPKQQETDNESDLEISFGQLDISGIDVHCDQASDEDVDLLEIEAALTAISHHDPITAADNSQDCHIIDPDFEDSLDDREALVQIEGITPFDESTQLETKIDQAAKMNFLRYSPPPFLLFRTAPWIGRDDDPKVVEGFINDLLVMADISDNEYAVLGVDQKIGGVHMKLEKANPRFQRVIREVPPLHLLKMKILNLCSGYRDAGLVHILKYLKDDDREDDVTKLLGLNNIRAASRLIHRLALSFVLAYQVLFIQNLPDSDAHSLLHQLQTENADVLADKWDSEFDDFIKAQSKQSATFQLHTDMMNHSIEVIGINLAERIGGPAGYSLLRGCMKSSLLFSFLNGASNYAAYTTHLLADHTAAPLLIQGLKEHYFSVPYENSGVNFGLDTIREEEHRRAKKFFRPRSDCSVIGKRMQRMEEANAMRESRARCLFPETVKDNSTPDHSNWKISDVDIKYILRGASLILRRLTQVENSEIPYNVYASPPVALSKGMLDEHAMDCGEYLLYKYCSSEKLFQLGQGDVDEKAKQVQGPKELVTKVLGSSCTTVKRYRIKPPKEMNAEEKTDEKRKRKLNQEKKRMDSLFSSQNTCQAIVDPACAKYRVMKSVNVPKAILAAVGTAIRMPAEGEEVICEDGMRDCTTKDIPALSKLCMEKEIIMLKQKFLPQHISQAIKAVTIENAGVHYKTGRKVACGADFIREFEDRWITETMVIAPAAKTLVISDEKYHFTPDVFKSATRNQRRKEPSSSIAHLKTSKEILSEESFARASIVGTQHGKQVASTFLAENAHKLSTRKEISIIFDSELYLHHCECPPGCTCINFTTPVECRFFSNGLQEQTLLHTVQQRKGEAECAQVDWVIELSHNLQEGEAILSIVSSADIDAVVLHLYALAKHLPRKGDGSFEIDVYVMLKKSGYVDLYNITGMISILEKAYGNAQICQMIAMMLAMGGNDFLPKFQNITHFKVVQQFLASPVYRQQLFHKEGSDLTEVDRKLFIDFMKDLYCPPSLHSGDLTFEEVRQLTIKPPTLKSRTSTDTITFSFADGQADLRHPRLWLPPKACLENLCSLYDAMLGYFAGLGKHDAALPDFSATCLATTSSDGSYTFGKEARVGRLKDLLEINENTLQLQKKYALARKRALQSTPKKQSTKRMHLSFTP